MKSQSVKQRAKIAESRERAPWRTGAQRGAGDPVEHPHRNNRSGAVWHLADRDQLTTTVVRVDDGNALPDKRMPGVVNFACVTDTGRMKRLLSSRAKSVAGIARIAVPTPNRSSPVSSAPRDNAASTRVTSSSICCTPRDLRSRARYNLAHNNRPANQLRLSHRPIRCLHAGASCGRAAGVS
jgi:hypothetical protein